MGGASAVSSPHAIATIAKRHNEATRAMGYSFVTAGTRSPSLLLIVHCGTALCKTPLAPAQNPAYNSPSFRGGYAKDLDEAEAIAKSNPSIAHEVRPM